MAYQQNIPLATDQLSQSQADILGNFQSIQPVFDQDHIDFNTANAGMHKWIELPTAGIPPVVAGTISLYNSANQLYIQPASGTAIPITSASPALNGWTWLPSGIMLIWGNTSSNVNTATHLPFTIPFPNNCFSITATLAAAFSHNDTINIALGDKTYFTCSIKNTSGTQEARNFSYLAIGN